MGGFSSLSSPDDSEVQQILAEAMDHCVLEQVASINCSSFSHSQLPSHLENRFQKLKTFPSSSSPKASELKNSAGRSKAPNFKENPGDGKGKNGNSQPGYISSPTHSSKSSSGHSKVPNFEENPADEKGKNGKSASGHSKISSFKETPGGRKGQKGKTPSGYDTSPSDSSNSSSGHSNSPKLKRNSGDGKGKNGKSRSGSVSKHSDTSDSDVEMGKSGCLWCSPKRVSRKKSVGRNGGAELGLDWGEHDDILSDLRSFSSKEQKKRMKEAMKEEEKINKEAEKIVKWAKQVSARMEFSISDDDELSDDNSGHHFGRQ